MRVELDPIEAFEHVLQLSLHLEKSLESQSQVVESERISHIFIRSFESDSSPFVAAEQSHLFLRIIDTLFYFVSSFFYTRHVVPYSLEGNLEYLQLLFEKIHHGTTRASEVEQFPREMRHQLRHYFRGDCRAALVSIIGRMETIVRKHRFTQDRRQQLTNKIADIRQIFDSIEHLPQVVHGRVVRGQEAQDLKNQLTDICEIEDYDFFCSEIKNAEARLKKIKASLSEEDAFSIACDIVKLRFDRKLERLAEPIVRSRTTPFQERSLFHEHVQILIDDYEDTYDQILDAVDWLKTFSTTLTGDIRRIDQLTRDLKAQLLEVIEEQLRKVFTRIGDELTRKITRTTTLLDFHAVHEEVRKSVCDLIELDSSIEDEVLYNVFHANIQKLGTEFQNARLPRQTEILNSEILPQVESFLQQASHFEDVEKIVNLQREIASHILFLQKTYSQLVSNNDAINEASLAVLSRIVRILQEAETTLQRRLDQLGHSSAHSATKAVACAPTGTVSQHMTGDGMRVVIANSPSAVVTINNGGGNNARGAEDESFFSQVVRGMLPAGSLTSNLLTYGPQVLLSAATIYCTGSVALTTSLLSGMVLTAAPAVVSSTVNAVSRQMLPQPLVPLMAPIVDFATRLLVLRYGPRVVALLAGNAGAGAPVTASIPAQNEPPSVPNGAAPAEAASNVVQAVPTTGSQATSAAPTSSNSVPNSTSSTSVSTSSAGSAPAVTNRDVLFAAGASVATPIARVALTRMQVLRTTTTSDASAASQSAVARSIRVQRRAQGVGSESPQRSTSPSASGSYSTDTLQSSIERTSWDITGMAMRAFGYVSALFVIANPHKIRTVI